MIPYDGRFPAERLLLLCMGALLLAAVPESEFLFARNHEENVLRAVHTRATEGSFDIMVEARHPIEAYNHFSYQDDDDGAYRSVVDLPGRWRNEARGAYRVDHPWIRGVRIGIHGKFLRIVVDSPKTETEVQAVLRRGNQMLISVWKRAPGAAPPRKIPRHWEKRGEEPTETTPPPAPEKRFAAPEEIPVDPVQSEVDLGIFADAEGDRRAAKAHFRKALDREPDNGTARFHLGVIAMDEARYPAAMEHFRRAVESDPDLPELEYHLAMAHFKAGDIERAVPLLTDVSEAEPANVLARYHAGLGLYRMGRCDAAAAYLTDAADASPTLRPHGRYAVGVCHAVRERPEAAVDMFEAVREDADAGPLRGLAQGWIEALERGERSRSPFHLEAEIGGRYDDNVGLDPVDEDGFGEEGDFLAFLRLAGTYLPINRPNLRLGLGYVGHQATHDDLSAYDITANTLRLFVDGRLAPFFFKLSLLPAYYWLDGRSALRHYRIVPEIRAAVRPNLLVRLIGSFTDATHFLDRGLCGQEGEAFLDADLSLLDRALSLFGGIGYEIFDARAARESYREPKGRLGVRWTFRRIYDLSVTGAYARRDYDAGPAGGSADREDRIYEVRLALARPFIYDWMKVVAQYDHTYRDSTDPAETHRRNRAGLSLVTVY